MKNLIHRRWTGPALLLAVCLSGAVALVAASRPAAPAGPAPAASVERQPAQLSPLAVSITPITSLTASKPSELGGSTTGSLYASADRIDIYARTGSSTATIALVEYQADDGKWVQHGTCPTVTTDLTLCRVVAKRGSRYWHVYKSAGTLAYAGIEASLGAVGLGSIEYTAPSGVTSVALTLPAEFSVDGSPITSSGTLAGTWASQAQGLVFAGPTGASPAAPTFRSLVAADVPSLDTGKLTSGTLGTTRGGTGLTSFTANRLFYSSSTSAVGQLGCSDGQVVTWASGVPACGSASSFDPTSPGPIGGTTPAAGTFTTVTGNTSVLSNLLDARTATTLAIGTTTATGIGLQQNTTLAAGKSFAAAAGASAFSWGSATGDTTFGTGAINYTGASGKAISLTASGTAGTITISTASTLSLRAGLSWGAEVQVNGARLMDWGIQQTGAVALPSGVDFIAVGGVTDVDFSPSSGFFKTPAGTNTLGGNVVISGSKTFDTGTGAVSINGSATVASGKTLTLDSGTATGSGLAATCSKQVCVITTEALTAAAGTSNTYTITNTLVTTASRPFCQGMGGTNTTPFDIQRAVPGSGSYTVKIFNSDNGSTALNGTVVFSCLIL